MAFDVRWASARLLRWLAVALVVGCGLGAAGARGGTASRVTAAQCVRDLGLNRPVTVRRGTTPAAVIAAYSVLRRPQTPADIPPAGVSPSQTLAGGLSTYDPSLTRLLVHSSAGSIYLVVGVAAGDVPLPAECKRKVPALLLRQRGLIRTLGGSGPAYAFIDVASSTGTGSGSSLGSISEEGQVTGFALSAEQGFAYATSDVGPEAHDLIALVPDGVGAVTLAFGPPTGSFSLTVQDNLATGAGPTISPPRATPRATAVWRRFIDAALPLTVTWLTAPGGSAVHVFARPPGIVDDYVELVQTSFALLSGPLQVSSSLTVCGPARRHGRTVQICTITSQTCTAKKVHGRTERHCTTRKRVTQHPPSG